MNQDTQYEFRLPTEAEWEYAARSGRKKEKYAGGNNLDDFAWYSKNSNRATHPVGEKMPNGLGLYDMSGNVYEWCEDIYFKNAYIKHNKKNPVYLESNSGSRVLRGGAWNGDAGYCRAAGRRWGVPSRRNSVIGFRLVSSPRSVI
jgi:formylglycine-generating enzyme required for sulfatase activity